MCFELISPSGYFVGHCRFRMESGHNAVSIGSIVVVVVTVIVDVPEVVGTVLLVEEARTPGWYIQSMTQIKSRKRFVTFLVRFHKALDQFIFFPDQSHPVIQDISVYSEHLCSHFYFGN